MKLHEGNFYPSTERGLQGDVSSLADVEEEILPYVKDRRICVQAGGAVGLWARKLSPHFDWVHSFEPNPELRECFYENTKGFGNITLHPKALGAKEGTGKMAGDKPWNMGSWWVESGEDFPITTVDSLNLINCDLLLLDIEGAEVDALKGATATLLVSKPVVVVESKIQCLARYGETRFSMHTVLREAGYRSVKAFHGGRDELWVPTQ